MKNHITVEELKQMIDEEMRRLNNEDFIDR